jgi:predicted O-methyltransferase YrrM
MDPFRIGIGRHAGQHRCFGVLWLEQQAFAPTPAPLLVAEAAHDPGQECEQGHPREPAPRSFKSAKHRLVQQVGPGHAAWQAADVLWLLHLLGREPGQAVLEIGSGSGWFAAVMGRLVDPAGKVVGIELIAGLAQQSRTDLEGVGVGNVEIVTEDGALGHGAGASYDRAVITAAT